MASLNVKGMSCQNCVKAVTEAVSKVKGAKNVTVNLEKATASWDDDPSSPANLDAIKKAIKEIGFETE